MAQSSEQYLTIATYAGILLVLLGGALSLLIATLIWVFNSTKQSLDQFIKSSDLKFESLIKAINELHGEIKVVVERTDTHGEEINFLRKHTEHINAELAKVKVLVKTKQ